MAAIIAAIGAAAYEAHKHLKEMTEEPQKVADAFHELNGAVEANADQLRQEKIAWRTRSRSWSISRRSRSLKRSMIAADRLAESLDKDIEKTAAVVKAHEVGWFDRHVMGHAGTADIEDWRLMASRPRSYVLIGPRAQLLPLASARATRQSLTRK